MKFPRNARIFRGQLDAAPFAAVLFSLVIMVMLTSLVYTPGVRIELPVADNLPGLDQPSVAVAIDATGRLYLENQVIEETQLRDKLRQAAQETAQPLALIVQADKSVSCELLTRLTLLAKETGISQAWLATLPRPQAPGP